LGILKKAAMLIFLSATHCGKHKKTLSNVILHARSIFVSQNHNLTELKNNAFKIVNC